MPRIPDVVAYSPSAAYLRGKGFSDPSCGKIRLTYTPPNRTHRLLVEATDRISAFDQVLPFFIEGKGAVLTAYTHWWLTQVFSDIPNHMVDESEMSELRRELPDLPFERFMLVKKAAPDLHEYIARMCAGGSIWSEYEERGTLAGVKVEGPKLQKWGRLPGPVFTPSTKAKVGHDVNITVAQFHEETNNQRHDAVELLLSIARRAYSKAQKEGILLLDTKCEFGRIKEAGTPHCILIDEVLTPDSSRYTTEAEYTAALAEGREPPFYDKQVLRDWLSGLETPFGFTGIKKLDPDNEQHMAYLDAICPPDGLIEETLRRIHFIFEKMVGATVKDYQQDGMHIAA